MTRLLFALVLCTLAASCESKASPPPPPAATPVAAPVVAEKATDADLRLFLNGMLVVSKAPPPRESGWPYPGESNFFKISGVREHAGIKTPEELKAVMLKPLDQVDNEDTQVMEQAGNWVRAYEAEKLLLATHPDSLMSAFGLIYDGLHFVDSKELYGIVTKVDSSKLITVPRMRWMLARFEMNRCTLATTVGQLEEALKFCNAAQAIDDEWARPQLAKVLLAMGKKKEGLTEATRAAAVPTAIDNDPLVSLVLGLAQQVNGQNDAAKNTWTQGFSRFPESTSLRLAASGAKKTVLEWHLAQRAEVNEEYARSLANGGALLAEMGLIDQSEACYAAADKIVQGPALAHRLIQLSMTNLDEAANRLTEATAKGEPHIHLMSAMGQVLNQQNKLPEAKAWLTRALALTWNDTKSMQVMWQVCSKQNDLLCVIEYRKRLGMPTHFNQEQYRDVNKAWQEQMDKNGMFIAVKDAPSTEQPKPSMLKAITLVPMGQFPELRSMDTYLNARFPGVKITIAPKEDPFGVIAVGAPAVTAARLQEKLRDEPGNLFVIEQDIAMPGDHFAYSQIELAKARGVVSLSRLRSFTGDSFPLGASVDVDVMNAVKNRVANLLANSVGKLLGLSFPCDDKSCPMTEQRSVKDLSVKPGQLCAKHQAELKARLAAP